MVTLGGDLTLATVDVSSGATANVANANSNVNNEPHIWYFIEDVTLV